MENQKHLFNIPDSVSYLNCAYMSPQLKKQTEAGKERMALMEQPYHIFAPDFFKPVEQAKSTFARLVNITDTDRVAIIPSASYGLANVAANIDFKPGDEILLLEEQFPSNVYIWQRLAQEKGVLVRFIGPGTVEDRSASWNENILDAVKDNTALVAIPNIHWADGTPFDLVAIRAKTREMNALLVIDGTQSVGAMPTDVEVLQPDALICAAYKWLLGPYGIGLAYYGPAFDDGRPIEENWINRLDSQDFKNLVNYQPAYKPKAQRYSVGEQSSFTLMPLLQTGLEQLLEWGIVNIQSYCENLFEEHLDSFRDLGCKIAAENRRSKHLFGIRLSESIDAEKLGRAFLHHQVFVSLRGSSIRVAPHVFNDEKDVLNLLTCFKAARKKQFY